MPKPRPYLRPIALWIAAAALTWSSKAKALDGCTVVLKPPDAGSEWKAAALHAERALASKENAPVDCHSIEIEVQREGNALLTFTTADGRNAVRLLHAPEDITPAIEALLVTLPNEPPPPAPPTTQASSLQKPDPSYTPPPPSPSNSQAPARIPPPKTPSLQYLIALSGGNRLGLDETVLGPAIILRATIALSPWELGVQGEWNPQYTLLAQKDPTGFSMYSFEISLIAGRRELLKHLEIPYGILMGLSAVHEEIDIDPNEKGALGVETFEPRVGVYTGFSYPRDTRLRLCMGLSFDAALTGLRNAGTTQKDLPPLPRFDLGFSLGMELVP